LASLAQASLPTPPLHLTVDSTRASPSRVWSIGASSRRASRALAHPLPPARGVLAGGRGGRGPVHRLRHLSSSGRSTRRNSASSMASRRARLVLHNNYEGDSLFTRDSAEAHQPGLRHAVRPSRPPVRRHPLYMPSTTRACWRCIGRRGSGSTRSMCASGRSSAPCCDTTPGKQWLLSYLVTVMGLEVHIWPEAFHSHGCFNEVRPARRAVLVAAGRR